MLALMDLISHKGQLKKTFKGFLKGTVLYLRSSFEFLVHLAVSRLKTEYRPFLPLLVTQVEFEQPLLCPFNLVLATISGYGQSKINS